MPRKARVDVPGAQHHIISLGIERNRIFRDNRDRDNFVERLENILVQARFVSVEDHETILAMVI